MTPSDQEQTESDENPVEISTFCSIDFTADTLSTSSFAASDAKVGAARP
jgi:hypothetical protein